MKNYRILIFLSTLFFCLNGSTKASGSFRDGFFDWFLHPNGDDVGGEGNSTSPWFSINRAVQSVSDGDTIFMAPGEYIYDAVTSIDDLTVSIVGLGATPEATHIALNESSTGNATIRFTSSINSNLSLENVHITYRVGAREGPVSSWTAVTVIGASKVAITRSALGIIDPVPGRISALFAEALEVTITSSNIATGVNFQTFIRAHLENSNFTGEYVVIAQGPPDDYNSTFTVINSRFNGFITGSSSTPNISNSVFSSDQPLGCFFFLNQNYRLTSRFINNRFENCFSSMSTGVWVTAFTVGGAPRPKTIFAGNIFRNNNAQDSEVLRVTGMDLDMTNSTFYNNTASGLLIGIMRFDGGAAIRNSRFYSNKCNGAVIIRSKDFLSDQPPFSIDSSSFERNVGVLGAGIRISAPANVSISRCSFLFNSASAGIDQSSTALAFDTRDTNVTVTDSVFVGNSAAGIRFSSIVVALSNRASMIFRNCSFDSNLSISTEPESVFDLPSSSGAIYANKELQLHSCRFFNNTNGFPRGARDVLFYSPGTISFTSEITTSGVGGIVVERGVTVLFLPSPTSGTITVTPQLISAEGMVTYDCTKTTCNFVDYLFRETTFLLDMNPLTLHNVRIESLFRIDGPSGCRVALTGSCAFMNYYADFRTCLIQGDAILSLGSIDGVIPNTMLLNNTVWTQTARARVSWPMYLDGARTSSEFTFTGASSSLEISTGRMMLTGGVSLLLESAVSFKWSPPSWRIQPAFHVSTASKITFPPTNCSMHIASHSVNEGDALPFILFGSVLEKANLLQNIQQLQFAIQDSDSLEIAELDGVVDGLIAPIRVGSVARSDCGDIGFRLSYCISANGTATALVYQLASFGNGTFYLNGNFLFSAGVQFHQNATLVIPWKRSVNFAESDLVVGTQTCPQYDVDANVTVVVQYDVRTVPKSNLTLITFNPAPISQGSCPPELINQTKLEYRFVHILNPQPNCSAIQWRQNLTTLELSNCEFPSYEAPIQPPTTPSPTMATNGVAASLIGAVVGAIVGVLIAVAIIAGIIAFLVVRNRKNNPKQQSTTSSMPMNVFHEDPDANWVEEKPEPSTTPAAPDVAKLIVDQSLLKDAIPLQQLTITQELGRGSWGTVSLALYNGEFVALKRVSSESADRIRTLAEEAKIMATIKTNRNLVRYLGVCADAGSLGIVMEFCPRGSLLQYLRRSSGSLSEYEIFKFAYGILEGMIALTSSKLVHRDLAARNVLLDEKLFAKVSDFGTARSVGIAEQSGASDDMLGPFKWQAPEVLAAKANADVSDVWSFGCTLLEIVTRQEPYAKYKGNVIELIQEIKSGSIDPLSHLERVDKDAMASWPAWVAPILKSCFIVDPGSRPSFREIRFQLSPKTRELQNTYDAEQDDIDSVLSGNYGAVPSGSPQASAEKISVSTLPSSTEVVATNSSAAASAESIQNVERLGKLGEGSFGAVYLGKFQGQYVAIKVLTISDQSIEEVRREAGIMSAISNHRNVIQLFGMLREDERLSIVMELAPKGSVESFIAASKNRIGEALLFKWALGIARGMAHLTASNIIHRDLSARNVLLDSSLEPKIADFGLGRRVLDPSQETSTQTDVGPLRWFAPECFDLKYSEKTDVWAYACTLFEIQTGAVPFSKKDVIGVFHAVKEEGLSPLDDLEEKAVSKIPKWLHATMSRCFARDAKDRPTFAELVSFVERQADTIEEVREAEAAIQRRRNMRAGTLIST